MPVPVNSITSCANAFQRSGVKRSRGQCSAQAGTSLYRPEVPNERVGIPDRVLAIGGQGARIEIERPDFVRVLRPEVVMEDAGGFEERRAVVRRPRDEGQDEERRDESQDGSEQPFTRTHAIIV